VFDATGAIVGRMDYGPYGEQLTSAEGVGRKVFAQVTFDGETAMDYAEARMYQPRTGRFNAPDALFADLANPQRLNRYGYALANPLGYTDPAGLMAANCTYTEETIDGGISGSITCTEPSGGAERSVSTNRTDPERRGEGSQSHGGLRRTPIIPTPLLLFTPAPHMFDEIVSAVNDAAAPALDTLRCANSLAQTHSLAAASRFSGNFVNEALLGNDIATVMGALVGPGHMTNTGQAIFSYTATTVGGAVGKYGLLQIPVREPRIFVHERPSGAWESVKSIGGALGDTVFGKLALGLSKVFLEGKIVYDAGIYVGSTIVCSQK
jgi:RHS repeat-associated protein